MCLFCFFYNFAVKLYSPYQHFHKTTDSNKYRNKKDDHLMINFIDNL